MKEITLPFKFGDVSYQLTITEIFPITDAENGDGLIPVEYTLTPDTADAEVIAAVDAHSDEALTAAVDAYLQEVFLAALTDAIEKNKAQVNDNDPSDSQPEGNIP